MHFYALVFAFLCIYSSQANAQDDRIKLSDIKVLTFKKDALTTTRYKRPVQQIYCLDYDLICLAYVPNVIECINNGTKNSKINWECRIPEASQKLLDPNGFRFYDVVVTCEGYDSPKDIYVLKGSCWVKYKLVRFTKKDENYKNENDNYNYNNNYNNRDSFSNNNYDRYSTQNNSTKKNKSFVLVINIIWIAGLFCAFLFGIGYAIYKTKCAEKGFKRTPNGPPPYPNYVPLQSPVPYPGYVPAQPTSGDGKA